MLKFIITYVKIHNYIVTYLSGIDIIILKDYNVMIEYSIFQE